MHRKKFYTAISTIAFGWAAVAAPALATAAGDGERLGSIEKRAWGKTKGGQTACLYTLANRNGMSVRVTDYGGIVVSLTAPDQNGKYEDVALGYDTLAEYVKEAYEPMITKAVQLCEQLGHPTDCRWLDDKSSLFYICNYSIDISQPKWRDKQKHAALRQEVKLIRDRLSAEFGKAAESVHIHVNPF